MTRLAKLAALALLLAALLPFEPVSTVARMLIASVLLCGAMVLVVCA